MLQLAKQSIFMVLPLLMNVESRYRHMPEGISEREKVARLASIAFLHISAQGLGYLTGLAIMGVSVSPIGWAVVGATAIAAIFMIIHQNKHNPRAIADQLVSAVGVYALSTLTTMFFTNLCLDEWEMVANNERTILSGLWVVACSIIMVYWDDSVYFYFSANGPHPQRQPRPQPVERPLLGPAADD